MKPSLEDETESKDLVQCGTESSVGGEKNAVKKDEKLFAV